MRNAALCFRRLILPLKGRGRPGVGCLLRENPLGADVRSPRVMHALEREQAANGPMDLSETVLEARASVKSDGCTAKVCVNKRLEYNLERSMGIEYTEMILYNKDGQMMDDKTRRAKINGAVGEHSSLTLIQLISKFQYLKDFLRNLLLTRRFHNLSDFLRNFLLSTRSHNLSDFLRNFLLTTRFHNLSDFLRNFLLITRSHNLKDFLRNFLLITRSHNLSDFLRNFLLIIRSHNLKDFLRNFLLITRSHNLSDFLRNFLLIIRSHNLKDFLRNFLLTTRSHNLSDFLKNFLLITRSHNLSDFLRNFLLIIKSHNLKNFLRNFLLTTRSHNLSDFLRNFLLITRSHNLKDFLRNFLLITRFHNLSDFLRNFLLITRSHNLKDFLRNFLLTTSSIPKQFTRPTSLRQPARYKPPGAESRARGRANQTRLLAQIGRAEPDTNPISRLSPAACRITSVPRERHPNKQRRPPTLLPLALLLLCPGRGVRSRTHGEIPTGEHLFSQHSATGLSSHTDRFKQRVPTGYQESHQVMRGCVVALRS
ncbi:hypothetical protein RRG08_010381 [Elysia crispata]|uniref:Uncharacterized protein n=1 Tax=Elysia crispata TaxID=231223 RepID=A0AAE1BAM1_9GAST|nr:hypothetical protein RRG08_010381 [Elysia crispata]